MASSPANMAPLHCLLHFLLLFLSQFCFHSKGDRERRWRRVSTDELQYFSRLLGADSFKCMEKLNHYGMQALRHRHDLYRSVASSSMDWNGRWALILNEIRELQPDILCLQEVDRFEQIQLDLGQLGYQGLFLRRSGDCLDGCATFWKSSYELMDFSKINFNQTLVLRDNVALICTLKHPQKTDSTQTKHSKSFVLTVANTHILFNPKRGDIKLAQLRILCDEMQRLSSIPRKQCFPSTSIVTGDFNSCPGSGIYKFMTQGSVNLTHYACNDMAGPIRAGFGGFTDSQIYTHDGSMPLVTNLSLPPWHPYPEDESGQQGRVSPRSGTPTKGDRRWWPPYLDPQKRESTDSDHCRPSRLSRMRRSHRYDFHWARRYTAPRIRALSHMELMQRFPGISGWSAEQIENVMGLEMPAVLRLATSKQRQNPFTLDHDLHLESAYQSVLGHEPAATSFHDHCKMTLDYVFFSPYVSQFFRNQYEFVTLNPCSVLEVPWVDRSNPTAKMPNAEQGSDHFSLCADFVCRWTRSYQEAGLSLPPPTRAMEEIQQRIHAAQQYMWRPRVYYPRRPRVEKFNAQSRKRYYKRRNPDKRAAQATKKHGHPAK